MTPERSGKFIVFEGVEGCGKTTQLNRLKQRLKSLGIPVVSTKEPGGTVIGRKLRKLLLNSQYELTPLAELLLYEADRTIHVEKLVKPNLAEGRVVICDRYADSTVAYQGYGRGIDRALIEKLAKTLAHDLVPDLTILLDIDPAVGVERSLERQSRLDDGQKEDKFEKEALDFHHRVRDGFLALSRKDPGRYLIVDVNGFSIGEVFESIASRVDRLLGVS